MNSAMKQASFEKKNLQKGIGLETQQKGMSLETQQKGMSLDWAQILCICLIFVLTACSSVRLKPQEAPRALEAPFFSMGTRWVLRLPTVEDPERFQKLKSQVVAMAMMHERTFSDWSEGSELRKLEKVGLGQWQKVSWLMFHGLMFSDQAFERTNGAFDITVGDRQWGGKKQAVGMEAYESRNVAGGNEIRFIGGVERLTFGGIAKGMALGDIAHFLKSQGVEEFSLDAGGGNAVRAEREGVTFESRSRVGKVGSQTEAHIFSPEGKMLGVQKTVIVSCEVDWGGRLNMSKWGALSDAYSTAVLVSSQRLELPTECRFAQPGA